MDRKQQDAKEGAGYAAHKYEKWAVRPSLPVIRAMRPSAPRSSSLPTRRAGLQTGRAGRADAMTARPCRLPRWTDGGAALIRRRRMRGRRTAGRK